MNTHSANQVNYICNLFNRLWPCTTATFALLLGALHVSAATYIVSTTNDNGAGSLRAAIAVATNGDTITFSLPSPSTITLTSGGLMISNCTLTIAGPGPGSLAIDGNRTNQVFGIIGFGSVTLSGMTITNGAGGIRIRRPPATVTISNAAVTGNFGSGIFAETAALQIVNSTISGNINSNNGSGGGVFYTGVIDGGACVLSMTNSTINGNFAGFGGGIYIQPLNHLDSFTFNFANVTVNSNQAYFGGGGIYIEQGPYKGLVLANLTVGGNAALGDRGGGISIYNSDVTLSNVCLIGNVARLSGGGIYNSGGVISNGVPFGTTLGVFSTTICSNSAATGGGIYSSGPGAGETAIIVFDSTVSYNSASGLGGGIYCDGTGGAHSAVINGSTFNGNIATNGGGVYNKGQVFNGYAGNAFLGITNSTFNANSAGVGGAIYNYYVLPDIEPRNGASTAEIFNSTLSANSATNGGGAIFNAAAGGGRAPVQIGSSILNAGPLGGTVVNSNGTVSSFGFNLSSDDAGGFFTNSTDLINIDPMLGPLQNNGGPVFTCALLPGSLAINQGFNFSTISNDERGLGYVRTYEYPSIPNAAGGDGTDIGAFELQPPPDAFALWQFQNFGCTNCPEAAPGADPDGDGANNMSEYLAGTNPNNSASVFRILSVTLQSNGLLVTWKTAGGHTNVVQSSASLTSGSFSDISSNIIIPGSGDAIASYLDTGVAANGASGYYRVRLGP